MLIETMTNDYYRYVIYLGVWEGMLNEWNWDVLFHKMNCLFQNRLWILDKKGLDIMSLVR